MFNDGNRESSLEKSKYIEIYKEERGIRLWLLFRCLLAKRNQNDVNH